MTGDDTRRTFKSSPGYVVSLHFWEQLTMATQNLIDLQCWAAKHKLVVVQPLISETYTRFTFSDALSSSWLRMDDLYNMSDWKQFSARNGLAPLVDRDQFLELATEQEMKVILVHFNYKKLNECTFDWPDGFDKAVQFALEHWHVVRNVCIIKPRIPTSVENLNRQIYGSFYPPRNVIVVFNMWRGIGGDRVPIPLSCSVGRKYMCQKKASDKLVWDTKAYAEKYLGGLGKYHAIVARFEKPVRSLGIDKAQMQEAIRTQIRQVLAKWKATKRMTSLSSTFLSFDYGSFGSDTFQKKDYYGAKDILIQFHQTVYANNMSIAEWEDTSEVITHTRHTAYIAQLQLQLAAHARCLFIVGIDSNFHHSVQQTYKNYHPTKRCIQVIGNVLQIPCYVY